MTCTKPYLPLAFAAALAFALPGGTLAAEAGADKPIATVNGVAIPSIYVEFIRRERAARGQSEEALSDAAIRDALIAAELLAQEALKAGIDKDPKIVALVAFQRKELLGRAVLEDYLRKHPVSEETLKAEYEKAKAKAGESEYRVRHILVTSEKEAKDIIAQLRKKAKFEDLAKKQSKDTSAGNGGDLGWVSPSNLVGEFADAMVKLKKGEYSKTPVQTRFGWHVIRLDDARPVKIPGYEEVKGRIAQQLQQIEVRKYLRELAGNAKVE